jgi:hypothetical protein
VPTQRKHLDPGPRREALSGYPRVGACRLGLLCSPMAPNGRHPRKCCHALILGPTERCRRCEGLLQGWNQPPHLAWHPSASLCRRRGAGEMDVPVVEGALGMAPSAEGCRLGFMTGCLSKKPTSLWVVVPIRSTPTAST